MLCFGFRSLMLLNQIVYQSITQLIEVLIRVIIACYMNWGQYLEGRLKKQIKLLFRPRCIFDLCMHSGKTNFKISLHGKKIYAINQCLSMINQSTFIISLFK